MLCEHPQGEGAQGSLTNNNSATDRRQCGPYASSMKSNTSGSITRVMAIVPHQDDFEFTMGGTFALLRKRYGDAIHLHIATTTAGETGHHKLSREETYLRRDAEARASAALIGATYECVTPLDGDRLHGQLYINRNFLGGIWNAIRAFRPEVIFAPAPALDPMAGVHIDHEHTAQAVRLVAYQTSAPHAFPVTRQQHDAHYPKPLILVVDDHYTKDAGYDIRQDISAVLETKLAMGACHESQIKEWLPWVNSGGAGEMTIAQWRETMIQRMKDINLRNGHPAEPLCEYFRITRWGRPPHPGEMELLFDLATEYTE